MQGHRVVMLQLIGVVGSGDGFRGHFSTSDSVDDFQLLVCQLDIFHVELVSDSPPPVFVFGFLDELFDFISGFFLDNFFELVIITEVLELIIPSVGDFANLDFDLLVLLIVRFVVADFNIVLVLLLPILWTGTLKTVLILCSFLLRWLTLLVGVNHSC